MTLHLGAAVAHIASIRTELAQRTGCTEWEPPGIRAALIATEGAPADVSAAACLAAGDPGLRLPSAAGFKAHWPKNASAPARVSNDVPCPEHALSEPCPACKARNEADAITEQERIRLAAELRAEITAGLNRFHTRPMPSRVPPPGDAPRTENQP